VHMKSKKEEIVEVLKTEILNLTLKPGDLVSEAMLTERFGISRTPIRDILKQLEKEGYIDIFPQKGSKVSYIDLNSVEQIVYLRNSLEKEIFKDLRSRISLSQKHSLAGILAKQASCIQGDNGYNDFLKYDDAFHHNCFIFLGREFLWDIIQQFNVHYLRYRQLNMKSEAKLKALYEEHKVLFNYLKGDDYVIEDLIHHHLRTDEINSDLADQVESYFA